MTVRRNPEIERKLERFVVDELLDERYDGRDPLLIGVVDSLDIEQLVSYIEEEFDLVFSDEEMNAENFESLAVLAAFVDSKRGSAAP